MMNHLDETLLNEYVDQALDENERQAVETHLAGCADCRERVEKLGTLFHALETLVEVPLVNDLSVPVMEQIQPIPVWRRWGTVVMLLQVVAVVVALLFLWPRLAPGVISLPDLYQGAGILLVEWQEILMINSGHFAQLAQSAYQQWALRPSLINMLPAQWALLAGLTLIIWLVGNRLIFMDDQYRERNGNNGEHYE